MNFIYVICTILFVYSITLGQVNSQPGPSPNKVDGEVVLSVDLSRSEKKDLRYTLKLRNDRSKAVYYSANPQEVCGAYGPYVSLNTEDSSVVDIQWRVFDRHLVNSLDCYTNNTRVELKRLEPGKSIEETVSINWPLSETAPPLLSRVHRSTIDRKKVKRIRFTVGYFEEEEGILKLLTGKPSGWFTKGDDLLEVGVFRGKRFYEIQQLVSSEVSIPEIKD